jgi:hypothetical protein
MLNSSVNMPTNINLYVSVLKPMNIKKPRRKDVIFLCCILSQANLSLEGMQSWHTSSHITFFFLFSLSRFPDFSIFYM